MPELPGRPTPSAAPLLANSTSPWPVGSRVHVPHLVCDGTVKAIDRFTLVVTMDDFGGVERVHPVDVTVPATAA